MEKGIKYTQGLEWNPMYPDTQAWIADIRDEITPENLSDLADRLSRRLAGDEANMDYALLRISAQDGVMYYRETIDDLGRVTREQVFDVELLTQTVVEGEYVQCVPLEYAQRLYDIGYELRMDDVEGGHVLVRIPSRAVNNIEKAVRLTEQEQDEQYEEERRESHLYECFATLMRIDNPEVRELVMELREVYLSEDEAADIGPTCRKIGYLIRDILNHPDYALDEEQVYALKALVGYSIEYDVAYDVVGVQVTPALVDDQLIVHSMGRFSELSVRLADVTLGNPEVELQGGQWVITGRCEPAYLFEFRTDNGVVHAPLPLAGIRSVTRSLDYAGYDGNREEDWRERYDQFCKLKPRGGVSVLDEIREVHENGQAAYKNSHNKGDAV